MAFITVLWLPILLSAVVVFVASAILHMVLKYHQSSCFHLNNEEQVLAAMRAQGVKPGYYHFPYTTHAEMKSAATDEKFKLGPVGFLTILPSGPPNMGKYLGSWFAYCIVVAFFTAYLTSNTIPAGAPFLFVFRAAGTAAIMTFALGPLANGIWKGQPWKMTLLEAFDGLIYGLLVGVVFAWRWPV
jgi:hypothetical protein